MTKKQLTPEDALRAAFAKAIEHLEGEDVTHTIFTDPNRGRQSLTAIKETHWQRFLDDRGYAQAELDRFAALELYKARIENERLKNGDLTPYDPTCGEIAAILNRE